MANKHIGFDVFIKIGEGKFTKIFSQDTGVDFERLAQYMSKGVKELYVLESDRTKLKEFLLNVPSNVFIDPKAPQEKKVDALMAMTEQNLFEIFNQDIISPEAANSSTQVVRHLVRTMTEDMRTISLLIGSLSKGNYLYRHSIVVSVYSVLVAKSAEMSTPQVLELVAMGGLLHDVGKSKLPEIPAGTTDISQLTDPELIKIYQSHPSVGLRMVDDNKLIPEEVKHIIFEHHERPDGKGYPNKLSGAQIYPLARYVRIANDFCKLINPGRPDVSPRPAQEAVQMMLAEQGAYDHHILRKFAAIFKR